MCFLRYRFAHGSNFSTGGLPFVQKNFTLVVLAIVVVSVVPVIFEVCAGVRRQFRNHNVLTTLRRKRSHLTFLHHPHAIRSGPPAAQIIQARKEGSAAHLK